MDDSCYSSYLNLLVELFVGCTEVLAGICQGGDVLVSSILQQALIDVFAAGNDAVAEVYGQLVQLVEAEVVSVLLQQVGLGVAEGNALLEVAAQARLEVVGEQRSDHFDIVKRRKKMARSPLSV